MKKVLLSLFLVFMLHTLKAQEDYTPMFTDGRVFTYEWLFQPHSEYIQKREVTTVVGDTIINNEVWKKCIAVCNQLIDNGEWELSTIYEYAIQEKDRMVYRHTYRGYYLWGDDETGTEGWIDKTYPFDPENVLVVYNFNITEGDKIDEYSIVEKDDSIMVKGRKYRRLTMDDDYHTPDIWVEGIGAAQRFSSVMTSFHCLLTSCYENDELIFEYDDFFAPSLNETSLGAAKAENPSAPMYNLSGERIATPRPGELYIQNGKVKKYGR